MKTLAELRAHLASIVAKLESFNNVSEIDESAEKEINALHEDFEKTQREISAKQKIEDMKSAANASAGRAVAPASTANAANAAVQVSESKEDRTHGFKSYGEFLKSVRMAAGGEHDKRLKNIAYEKNGEDGGFLIPDEFMSDIQKKLGGDSSLLSKTKQYKVSGNNLTLPIDEKQPWNGGIQAYWVNEGGSLTASKPQLGQASWKLNKLGVLVPVTDELLEDAVAMESYIRQNAPGAIEHKINGAIIRGDGAGKPVGILSSGFKVKVSKESGQTADTIVARNVIKMYSHLFPMSLGSAAWYVNAMCVEQLRTMKDDQGNFIYLTPGSQMNSAPYALLLGLPVIPMLGSMSALGDEGDIILADLSYYNTLQKVGGMKQAVSSHLYFDRDVTAYKFTMRIDGSCPYKTPVTTEFGNYQMSAIITLEDRA